MSDASKKIKIEHKLRELQSESEELDAELMRASSVEEIEYVKSKRAEVDEKIEELEKLRS